MTDGEDVKVQKASYLFERYAIIFFFILLLIAIWFTFLPVIIVTSFLLLLSILIIVWKEKSLQHVHVDFSPTKTRLFAGESFHITVSILNDKWLPLVWLELDFPESEYILLGKYVENKYILRFLWLMTYQQVKWDVQAEGFKRGVYQTRDITLKSGDGFRFTEKSLSLEMDQTFYIYPKLVAVHVPSFSSSMQWEVQGSHGGFLEDPLLISGTREYEVGDSWNRLNVRATAKTGKLQTNMYERIATKQLFLYVNVRGFEIDEEKYADDLQKQQDYELYMKEEFEFFLSVIASFAVAYDEKDVQIGYVSNGLNYFGKKQPFVSPSTRLPTVLDQLALISEKQLNENMTPLEESVLTNKIKAPLFIFCHSITESDYRWYVQHNNKLSVQFYYVQSSDYSVKLQHIATPIESLLANMAVKENE